MKLFLKAFVSMCTLGVGVLLGIYLLDWSVLWKVTLFYFVCWGAGHLVYALFRAIDRRFGS